MFDDFFFRLKGKKIPVSSSELMDFLKIVKFRIEKDGTIPLTNLYTLSRSCLVKDIKYFDDFDLVFAATFGNLELNDSQFQAILAEWLRIAEENKLSEDAKENAMKLETSEVFSELERRLREQKERHDKGNYYLGTGGTSAFGNKGYNQNGVRVGGEGGEGIAIQILGDRNYREYRTDESLNVRQLKVALKKLKSLRKEGRKEFQLDPTIKKTCENGGELEIIFQSSRKNKLKLVLLMDVGGSMTPHSRSVSRLFSAAHQMNHFKEFHYYYFHNIIYDRVFLDSTFDTSLSIERLFQKISPDTKVIFVGDAAMNPYELFGSYGSSFSYNYFGEGHKNKVTGISTLQRITKYYEKCVWINPDSPTYWSSTSCEAIGNEMPMFYLSVNGLSAAIRELL